MFSSLNENSVQAKQPKGISIKLKPHQLTAIHAMLEMEKNKPIRIGKPSEDNNKLLAEFINNQSHGKIDDDTINNNMIFEFETFAGIFADKVGAGKTYSILGLILSNKIPEKRDINFYSNPYMRFYALPEYDCVPTNLIVVGHGLTTQWDIFASKTNLKYFVFNRTIDFDQFYTIETVEDDDAELFTERKEEILNVDNFRIDFDELGCEKIEQIEEIDGVIYPDNELEICYDEFGNLTIKRIYFVDKQKPRKTIKTVKLNKVKKFLKKTDLIILNINRYKEFMNVFKNIRWARVILDEMDKIRLPLSFRERGNFNWFVSATPKSFGGGKDSFIPQIFYDLKTCGGSRYLYRYGFDSSMLDYLTVKNINEYIDKSMVLPKPDVYFIISKMNRVIEAIAEFIDPELMTLISSGNLKEAVNRMNCNIDTEENIIQVMTKNLKNEIHNQKERLKYVKGRIYQVEAEKQKAIDEIKKKIISLKTRKRSIEEKIMSVKDECCVLCMDKFMGPVVMNCCASTFCIECLLRSVKINRKCPNCRANFKGEKSYNLIMEKQPKKNKHVPEMKSIKFNECEKMDALKEMLKYISSVHTDEPARVLIFSDYRETFDKIMPCIRDCGMTYEKLHGNPGHINNCINRYETGDLNILMLDSVHFGSGLNLQCTDYLILFHRMRKDTETQVVGRAQRYGRKNPLKIIYMVYENENKDSPDSENPIFIENSDMLTLLTETEINMENDVIEKTPKKKKKKVIDSDDEEINKKKKKKVIDSDDEEINKKKKKKVIDSDDEEINKKKKSIKKKKKIVYSDSE